MNVNIPKVNEPITDKGEPPSRGWRMFFSQLASALGLDAGTPIYQDHWIDANIMGQIGGAASDFVISGETKALGVVDGDIAFQFSFKLPNNYKDGTDILPYFEWIANSASTNSVRWVFGYSIANDNEAFSTEVEEVSLKAWGGVALVRTSVDLTEISGSLLSKGAVISCKVARNGSHLSDTLAETVGLLGVGIKYQVDGVGNEKRFP